MTPSSTLKLRTTSGAPASTGPGAMPLAAALQQKPTFPQWYDEMPPGGVPFFVYNNGNTLGGPSAAIPSPNYGAGNQVVLASYQCPSNFVAVIKGVLTTFEGSGFIPGSGNIIWTLDVDTPAPALVGAVGYAFDGYGKLLTPMGSYANGLWKIYPGLRFTDGEIVRLKVQTVAVVGQGAPNYMNGMLGGWIVPIHLANL
jgi:hypothetical protein